MNRATHNRENETVIILVSIPLTTDTIKDIVHGSILKIYISQQNNTEKELQQPILSVDLENGIIMISIWENYGATDKLFVYGTKVNNFLIVDKPQLGVMALQGVKELNAIIQQQASTITTLESRLASLEQRLINAGIA
jgi:hypothetical protein